MLNCFDNKYALSPLVLDAPTNVQYLSEHQYVKIVRAERLTSEENVGALDVWSNIMTRGKRNFISDFKRLGMKFVSSFSKSYELPNFRVEDPADEYTTDTLTHGVYIKCPVSRYMDFTLERIQIYVADGEGYYNIILCDTHTGQVLYSNSNQLISIGLNTINVNKTFAGGTKYGGLILAVEFQGVSDIEDMTPVSLTTFETVSGPMPECGCKFYENCNIQGATITTGDPYIMANIDLKGSQTFGIMPIGYFECSIDALLCNHYSLFSEAFYLRLVIEFLNEILGSDRINYLTLKMDKKTVNESLFGRSTEVAGQKAGGVIEEYESLMEAILTDFSPRSGDCICFECNHGIKQEVRFP